MKENSNKKIQNMNEKSQNEIKEMEEKYRIILNQNRERMEQILLLFQNDVQNAINNYF